LETVGELFVVEAEFVALAVDVTSLEAGAGHPYREGFDVVVSADGLAIFAHWGAAEFTAPDDEGCLLTFRAL
jgi:hypothetical protein